MNKELGLYCLHYTDFCYGDKSSEACDNFERAKQLAL